MLGVRAGHLDGQNMTRTPGRALKGRGGMQENATRAAPLTVGGKEKSRFPSHTPFQVKSHQILLKDGGQQSVSPLKRELGSRTVLRPLGDKTPFPNRAQQQYTTPLPGKLGKLVLVDRPTTSYLHPGGTPDFALRPSSTRKHARSPRSAVKNFETPMTTGNHWDVSDGSICVPEAHAEEGEEETEDHDEIEYMPPKLELPYTPPFDFELPNYKELGASFLQVTRSYPVDETPLSPLDLNEGYTFERPAWESIPLPKLGDDDPFSQYADTTPSVTVKRGAAKPVPSRTSRQPVSRPATSMHARGTISAQSRTASRLANISRPGTATSIATQIKAGGARMASTGASRVTRSAVTTSARAGVPSTGGRATALSARPTFGANPATVRSYPARAGAPVEPGAASTKTITLTAAKRDASTATPLRRPATSASTYKPSAASTSAQKSVSRSKPAQPVTATSVDGWLLDLRAAGETANFDEDFRFEI
ncbi:hypothetical protein HGRIS_003071 [Hohenbuehelia grisea]|uniref:Uncharacterized protein n=1 Tax=Hohenbuehelia grisea TaxID=104357 RepID=A0ABR3JMD7_9AGAR